LKPVFNTTQKVKNKLKTHQNETILSYVANECHSVRSIDLQIKQAGNSWPDVFHWYRDVLFNL